MISITQTPQGWLARITTRGIYMEKRLSTFDQARLWIYSTINQLQAERAS